MSWYNYDYACGHGSNRVQIYGPTRDRQRKADWYARTFVCPDCYRAKQKKKKEEEIKKEEEKKELQSKYNGRYRSAEGRIAAIEIVDCNTVRISEMADNMQVTMVDVPLQALVGGIETGKTQKIEEV